MFYDVAYLWIWLLLSLLLGGAVGWRTEAAGPQEDWFVGWFRVAIIALGVAVVASVLHLLPGRAAFWLESAALFFIAYLIGCLLGGALQRARAA